MKHKDNGLVPDDIFMSKRLQVTTQLMAGLLSGIAKDQLWLASEIAEVALYCADELIKQEAGNEPDGSK